MFEHIGYSKDYYAGGQFVGYTIVDQPDREINGRMGRIEEVLTKDVICTNKKRIKAGRTVVTEQIPLCGKLKIKFN